MEEQLKRVRDRLEKTDVGTSVYDRLLDEYIKIEEHLYYVSIRVQYDTPANWSPSKVVDEEVKPVEESKAVATPVKEPEMPKETWYEEKTVPGKDPVPVEEEKPKAKKKEEPASKYTMEETRALLSEASRNGVEIKNVIEKFIPEGQATKFSNVPSSAYGDLIEELKKYAG